jgi:hypothetical protein
VSATAVILTMPVLAAVPALLGSAGTLGEYLKTFEAVAHEGERRPCPICQHKGHDVRWRAYPVVDPGPCPPGDVLTDVVEGCWCCIWSTGPYRIAEPLMDRLERERHDDRDIHVDHLGRDGRWTKFETRF